MSAGMTRGITAATPPAPVNAPASRCRWLPNSYGWPWSSSFEPWTSNHQLDTPNFRTTHRILNSWLTYFSASFIFYGFFFFLNWLCQTLRHPRGVTSGHAMQWKRVSPPVGGLTWGNALTLSELDLVSPDLIWGQLSYIALWNPPNLTLACLSTLAFITFLRVAFASDMPAFLPFPNHSNYVHSCLVHLHALLFSAWNVFPFRAHLASSYHSLCLRSRVLFLKLFLGFLGKVKDSLLYHLMVLFNLYPP